MSEARSGVERSRLARWMFANASRLVAIGLAAALVGGWSSQPIEAAGVLQPLRSEPVPKPPLRHGIVTLGPTVIETDPERVERVEPSFTLVAKAVSDQIRAYGEPNLRAPALSTFSHPTAIGGPLVFQAMGPAVEGWIEVRLPIRPNGSTGWIQAADVELTRNPYRIDLDVKGHELVIFRNEGVVLTTPVAIGTGSTPTPIGEFYLTELLRTPDPDGVYGPYAYGLSGFSETLSSFNGGPGIIGLHGTNRPDLLGIDVSHGCVRIENDVIAEIAQFLPLGTPISIH